MFKRIKPLFDVETKTGECNFYFIKEIGVVEMISGSEKYRIQSVFYTPYIDRNVLSFDQLITQGYTVKFTGDQCKIYPTFSIPVFNKRNEMSGYTKEDDIGNKEKNEMLKSETEYEKFKNDYLNSYFESLNITTEEPDWNVMIAYAENNRKVSLLDLYLAVKRDGGHRRVTVNQMWAVIAKDMGLDYNDAELMRLMYAMYLDVLVYYYKIKSTQGAAAEKEISEDVGEKRRTRSMELDTETSEQSGAEQEGAIDEHYAFFAGNDWYGLK
ncbi:putative transcription factor & chromatin remodeling ARID family [Helianthus anomalus]